MLWICNGCTTLYSVDASACPHCGSVERREYGDAVRDEGAKLAARGPKAATAVPAPDEKEA